MSFYLCSAGYLSLSNVLVTAMELTMASSFRFIVDSGHEPITLTILERSKLPIYWIDDLYLPLILRETLCDGLPLVLPVTVDGDKACRLISQSKNSDEV